MNILDELSRRKVDHRLYKCWLDLDNNVITFPLWSTTGKFVGRLTFNPDGTKDRKAKDIIKKYDVYSTEETVWGLEYLWGRNFLVPEYRNVVFVTESIFKAIALHRVGLPAISLNGSTMSQTLMNKLLDYQLANFVWVGDNDESGHKALKYFRRGTTSPKDLDELTDKELIEFRSYLINEFPYEGNEYEPVKTDPRKVKEAFFRIHAGFKN